MTLTVDKYDAKEVELSLEEIAEDYNKTKLDGSFQRWGGYSHGSGWSRKQGIEYLEELVVGGAMNSIKLASVEKCLTYALSKNDISSIEYFQARKDEGYTFVSIDGNNSASYIDALLTDVEDIKISINNNPEKRRFSQLTPEEQKFIKRIKLKVYVFREITIKQVCHQFRKINTQSQMNRQEYRQAQWSPLSEFIRNVSNDFNDNKYLFKKFIFTNDLDLDGRRHEEMVAKLALKHNKNFTTNTGVNELDELYENTYDLSNPIKKKIKAILEHTRQMAVDAPLQRKIKKNQVLKLFDVIDIVLKSDFKILNHLGLWEWYLCKDFQFETTGKNVPEGDQELDSYNYWTRRLDNAQRSNKIRTLFTYALGEDAEELIKEGIIKYKRSSKDIFSWEDKKELLVQQNFKTRKGANMRIVDLYYGNLEADHVVSVKDGGKTIISNAELMSATDNRSKGAKSNEPYFDFQKKAANPIK